MKTRNLALTMSCLTAGLLLATSRVQAQVIPSHTKGPVPSVEGKWARSPKGQLVAFVRIPDHGATELWVRHTKDGSTTLLRRGGLGIPTRNVRHVKVAWEGKLIRLESLGRVRYFDLKGRQVRS